MKSMKLDNPLINEMGIICAEVDGVVERVIKDEYWIFRSIKHITSIMELASNRKVKDFTLKKNQFGLNINKIGASGVGESILNLLKIDTNELLTHYPRHTFNPYFDVFLNRSKQYGLHEWVTAIEELGAQQLPALIDKLNAFLRSMQDDFQSSAFRREVSNLRRKASKNYKSLLKYLGELFKKHSKLLIMRLDLTYKKSENISLNNVFTPSYAEVNEHREALLRSLDKHLKAISPEAGLVGYVWKLEYGLMKSWHFHFIVIMNGQKVRQDVLWAKVIGKYWMRITKGKGIYHSCNQSKKKYKIPGIGLIDHSNADLRKGLCLVAAYLTKLDAFIRVALPENKRAFGKGIVRRTASRGVGRPRKHVSHIKESAPVQYWPAGEAPEAC